MEIRYSANEIEIFLKVLEEAEGRSREESEEEPFQEGGKQGHKAGGSAGEKEAHEVRG